MLLRVMVRGRGPGSGGAGRFGAPNANAAVPRYLNPRGRRRRFFHLCPRVTEVPRPHPPTAHSTTPPCSSAHCERQISKVGSGAPGHTCKTKSGFFLLPNPTAVEMGVGGAGGGGREADAAAQRHGGVGAKHEDIERSACTAQLAAAAKKGGEREHRRSIFLTTRGARERSRTASTPRRKLPVIPRVPAREPPRDHRPPQTRATAA